jgi:hypothetical protein
MNFLFVALDIDDAIHEIHEFPALPAFVMAGFTKQMAVSIAAKSVVMPCLLYS